MRVQRFSDLPALASLPSKLPALGDRVVAVLWQPSNVIDDNVTVPPGTQGTVDWVDDLQIGVKWDNGARLNIIPGDVWKPA